MKTYITLSETLNNLRKQGYTEDFNLRQNCQESKMFADDFKVDSYYRFEGETNPSDAAIVYAISSERHNLKGVLVNAYGIYSEPMTDEMMEGLHI